MEKNHLDWDNFPIEIAQEILSHLPAEYALQCKQVSKTWKNFFGHMQEGMLFAIGLNRKEEPNLRLYYATHDLIEMHSGFKKAKKYYNIVKTVHHPPIGNRFHKNPSEKYKDVIVGSCNGLVCITLPNGVIDDPIYMLNPFTRESVNLPRLTSIGTESGLVVSGFGFHSTREHKVVRIYYPDQNISVGHVEVYTLGGGTGWRNKGEITYSLCPSPGVLVDGILYWIDYKAMKIVGFNLADEKFRILLPSPPCLYLDKVTSNNNFHSVQQGYRLKVLRGCLCVVHYVRASKRVFFMNNASESIDIWFFTKNVDGQDKNLGSNCSYWSWRRTFSIGHGNIEDDYDPFFVTEKNKVLLWRNKSDLVCFDPKELSSKVIIKDENSLGLKYFSAIRHINTLVSLKALEGKICTVQEWDGKETLDDLRKVRQPQETREIYFHPGAIIYMRIGFLVFIISFLCCFSNPKPPKEKN